MCLPFYSFCLSCAGFGVRFLSKESFITSKLSLCVLSLTPLRFLKALLIFVTQKLNFLSLLFIVVDFLLEYGETLKGEKYPFERILYSSLLKMSFVQQNSMKFGGMGGGGGLGNVLEFTFVVNLTEYFSRLPFKVTFPYSGFIAAHCRVYSRVNKLTTTNTRHSRLSERSLRRMLSSGM